MVQTPFKVIPESGHTEPVAVLEEGDPQEEMLHIVTLLEELEGYKTDLQNPEVDKVVENIRQSLEPFKGWCIENTVVPALVGSLVYHDPYHMDIDLEWISAGPVNYVDTGKMHNNLPDYIGADYEDLFHLSLNPGYASISDTKKYLAELIADEGEEIPHWIDLQLSLSPSVLNAVPLFVEQIVQLDKMRQEYIELLGQYPILRAYVIETLEECVSIRRERRRKLAQ